MRSRSILALLFGFALTTTLGWSHYTWLVRTHYSASGDTAFLELGHGDKFPVSEEASSTTNLKAYLVGQDGARKPLEISASPSALKIEAKLPSKQMARVYYVRDRGVISQTSAGWKAGGKDKYPDAKASRRSVQYGVSWIGFSGTTNNAAPIGLELELNYESGIRGRLVRAWRNGKPLRNLEIVAILEDGKVIKLDQTDRDGYVKLGSVPEDVPVLFSASLTEKASKGSNFDETVLSCTLALPAK